MLDEDEAQNQLNSSTVMVERKESLDKLVDEQYDNIDSSEILNMQASQCHEAKFLVTNIKVFEEYQN